MEGGHLFKGGSDYSLILVELKEIKLKEIKLKEIKLKEIKLNKVAVTNGFSMYPYTYYMKQ